MEKLPSYDGTYWKSDWGIIEVNENVIGYRYYVVHDPRVEAEVFDTERDFIAFMESIHARRLQL